MSRRLVVVVVAGRPPALGALARLGDALVLCFHPGVEGGHGIVDVLTGDVPPSGRLPASLPWTTGQVPLHHDHLATGRPLDPDGPEGRYRDHLDTPLHPFGHGLGYAPVIYETLTLSAPRLRVGEAVRACAQVRNDGRRPAVETVQLYVRAHVAGLARPVGELVGVRRVPLAPGEAREVVFDLDHALLGHRDAGGRLRCDGGAFTVRVAPHAGADAGVTARLEVDPEP